MTGVNHDELGLFLAAEGIDQWGVARCAPALWPWAPDLPFAISLGMHVDSTIIAEVVHGPTAAYFGEYERINGRLDRTVEALVALLMEWGGRAEAVRPTGSPNASVTDWADARVFPHKTAATQAGLGWIGKTALFVSPTRGPRVRLASVFTDLELPVGQPVTVSRCRSCRRCLDACPAHAGRDVAWRAGMCRAELLDVKACERQNASNKRNVGDICGICVAVCPVGRRAVDRERPASVADRTPPEPCEQQGSPTRLG